MKRFFPFTTLFLILLAAAGCEQYECRNGDSYHMGDYYCDNDEGGCPEKMMLFEQCLDRGCNLKTGKCNTWKDPETGLRWSSLGGWRKRCGKAVTYCDNLYEAGGHGWRLPTDSELDGISCRSSSCENIFAPEPYGELQSTTHCEEIKNHLSDILRYVRCVRDE
ncbi:hypothetical protein IKS86_03040 [bacterium]|nr:hypothetical protein [bacterium]